MTLTLLMQERVESSIALAGRSLQRLAVQDAYESAFIADDVLVFESGCHAGHARAPRAQVTSDLLLRESQRVCARAVLNREQPAAEAFFDLVPTVADRPL